MNQTDKVLPKDTLRMFPRQGTSFPRHLMIAFRTLAGPTSQILQLASLTRCHRQVGQWILQSPVNPCLSLPNREIWHCIAAPKSSIAVSSQILFICPTVHCLPPTPPAPSVKSDSQVTRVRQPLVMHRKFRKSDQISLKCSTLCGLLTNSGRFPCV